MHFRTLILLCAFRFAAVAGKQVVDFSQYHEPLYDQIVNRIKSNIAPRLGPGPLKQERYFMIPFAYQDDGNRPEMSHSFITVIRVFADDKPADLTPELPTRQYKGWEFEAFTI